MMPWALQARVRLLLTDVYGAFGVVNERYPISFPGPTPQVLFLVALARRIRNALLQSFLHLLIASSRVHDGNTVLAGFPMVQRFGSAASGGLFQCIF